MAKPCVFFDRDGIVNVAPPPEEYYVLKPERFFIYPAFIESVRVARERGYAAVIVTNQRCLERGLLTESELDRIHDRLRAALEEASLELDGIYVAAYGGDHPDRKPKPGLLLRAAEDLDLDLSRSWMIGDSERDVEAGIAAGCRVTLRVGKPCEGSRADHRLDAVEALPGFLESHLPEV